MKRIIRTLVPAAAAATATLCVALADGSSPTIPDPIPVKKVAMVQPSDGSLSAYDNCGSYGGIPILCLDSSLGS